MWKVYVCGGLEHYVNGGGTLFLLSINYVYVYIHVKLIWVFIGACFIQQFCVFIYACVKFTVPARSKCFMCDV